MSIEVEVKLKIKDKHGMEKILKRLGYSTEDMTRSIIMESSNNEPKYIKVRGAKVHNGLGKF